MEQPESCKLLENRLNHAETEMKATLRLEYVEINRWLRQIEVGWWAVGSVLTAMMGTFMHYYANSLIQGTVAGFFLLIIWWLYLCFTKYAYRQSKSYSSRSKQIEKELGMEFFLNAKERFNSGKKYRLKDFFSSKAPDKSGTSFLPELNFAEFISVITIMMTIAWLFVVFYQVLIHFGFLQSIYKCVGAIPH